MYACDFAKKLHSLVMFTKVIVYKCMGQANSKEVEKIEKKLFLTIFPVLKLCLYIENMISHTHSARCCQSFLTNPFFMQKYLQLVEQLVKELHLVEVENIRRNSYYETRSC